MKDNKNMNAFEYDFSNLFKFENQLSQIGRALSKLSSSAFTETIQRERSYFNNFSNALLQIDNSFMQYRNLFSTPLQLENSIMQAQTAIANLHSIPTISADYERLSQQLKAFTASESVINQFAKTLELYKSPTLAAQMENVLSVTQSLDSKLLDAAKRFDLSQVELHEDDILEYDGNKYTYAEIENELQNQIETAKSGKLPLREKFEILQKKFWLVFLILNLIFLLPDIPEKVEFYNNVITQAREVASEKSLICFTIKEQAYLREAPNSKSSITLILEYDTPLEIIDRIPRWYKVKFISEDGQETIGWISKISVETED